MNWLRANQLESDTFVAILWYEIGGQMLKKMFVWGSVFFIAVFFTYAIWVVVAANRSATISVDYIAKVNEVANAVPEEERAWPLYREAGIALKNNPMPSSVFIDNEVPEPAWPSDEGWSHFDSWLSAHKKSIHTIHDATNKTGFGFLVSDTTSETDKELWPESFFAQSENQETGLMLDVRMPHLGVMREMARALSIDAKSAAFYGDSNRCLQDINSMLKLGTHTREHPFLIADLVSFSIYSIAFQTIGDILEHQPTLFSSDQFVLLENNLSSLDDQLKIRLEGERYFMFDFLQRIYSDNGSGDGRVVPLAIETFQILADEGYFFLGTAPPFSFFSTPFIPFSDILHASRKEMLEEYNRRIDKSEALIGMPLFEIKENPSLLTNEYQPSLSVFDTYFLVNLLTPALDKAIMQGEIVRGKRDATLAALFAVQMHVSTGKWPVDLAKAETMDVWSGNPLLIKLQDGQPIIYSVGFNQKDDGGIHDRRALDWHGSKNDWVYWPSPR